MFRREVYALVRPAMPKTGSSGKPLTPSIPMAVGPELPLKTSSDARQGDDVNPGATVKTARMSVRCPVAATSLPLRSREADCPAERLMALVGPTAIPAALKKPSVPAQGAFVKATMFSRSVWVLVRPTIAKLVAPAGAVCAKPVADTATILISSSAQNVGSRFIEFHLFHVPQ